MIMKMILIKINEIILFRKKFMRMIILKFNRLFEVKLRFMNDYCEFIWFEMNWLVRGILILIDNRKI